MRSFSRSLLFALALSTSQILPANAAIKIMPLGDSITEWGCWRAYLWDYLSSQGFANNIDFVGTQRDGPHRCPGYNSYDVENEGHAGFEATVIAAKNELVPWLASSRPDIVLMHLGTNDSSNMKTPAEVIAAFNKLVDDMRASNPNMIILVARIIPATTPGGQMFIPTLNNEIEAFVASKSTVASPIVTVNQYTGFDTAVDTVDGVHPNQSGDRKIAARWLGPLQGAIQLARSRGVASVPVSPEPVGTASVLVSANPAGAANVPVSPGSTGTASVLVSPKPPGPPSVQVSSVPTVTVWSQCGVSDLQLGCPPSSPRVAPDRDRLLTDRQQGSGYTGDTRCAAGYTCKKHSESYSLCGP
ncbi:SGNH hydrolase [Ascobolus immersus RN42]|uniref:SGNH hydrolase n=1 Tax=Ascobolus immersus RN42 TaxID=1160509 RepID=A0A3N4HZX8_ASCIM|nr:SGNH hydrolase [Ascobolus immersus RN42]